MASAFGGGFERMVAVLAHVVSWAAACWMLGLVALVGAIRLLCEWQRRTTLVAIVQHAPGGTVVVQEAGLGGPAMWVQVGNGPPSPAEWRPGITRLSAR